MGDEEKKERKKYDMHLRITKTEFDELEMASYLTDKSKSECIRRAISSYCKLLRYAPEVIEEYERRENMNGRTN